jgi:hypothetical protein
LFTYQIDNFQSIEVFYKVENETIIHDSIRTAARAWPASQGKI